MFAKNTPSQVPSVQGSSKSVLSTILTFYQLNDLQISDRDHMVDIALFNMSISYKT